MSGALHGRVVVVTGGTRGIGRAIAEACAAEEAVVVVCSRSEDSVCETVHALAAAHRRCSGMVADVRSEHDLECLFEHALDHWGGIDAWVNNAGVSCGYRPLDELGPEEIRQVVDTNLTSAMLACAMLVPYFAEHPGTILNLAGRGYRGDPTPHTAAYAATKAAIVSLTRSIAAENRRYPISIHALVPGMVETDFYRDLRVSERLAAHAEDWRYALDAFGVPSEEVGRRAASILAEPPGRSTGRVYSLLGGVRLARGIGKMMVHRMRGRIGPDS